MACLNRNVIMSHNILLSALPAHGLNGGRESGGERGDGKCRKREEQNEEKTSK